VPSKGWLVAAENFWLEYVDACGERHGGPLEVMWPARFETAGQVRGFPSYRGQRNFPGWYWAATGGDLVGYESWVELGHLKRLDAEPDVVAVQRPGPADPPYAGLLRTPSGRHR
jgi:hypothetical protein